MKKNKKLLIGLLALALVFGMTVISCELEDVNTYTFDNQSSYSVSVSCSDLDPSSFSISAGQTKTATSIKTSIQIKYTPANYVAASNSSGKFTFTNK